MSDEVRAWDGLAAAVSADRALLGPAASALLADMFDRYLRLSHERPSPAHLHVRNVLALVGSQARSGLPDVRCVPDLPASESWITTAQVVESTGLGERQCRRLMVDGAFGESRVVRRRRMVQADEVAAYVAARAESEAG